MDNSNISYSYVDENKKPLMKTSDDNKKKMENMLMRQYWTDLGVLKANSSNAGVVTARSYGGVTPGVKGIRSPNILLNKFGSTARGIREKYTPYNFWMLREVARKVSVIPAIQTTRIQQLRPFAKFSFNDDEVGWRIKLKDKDATPDARDKKEMKRMAEFIQYSGWRIINGQKIKRDGIYNMLSKNTREMMTIDQVALSLQRNRKGELIAYYILDAAYIKRTIDGKGYDGDPSIKFVQEIDGQVTATFKENELMFIINNEKSELLNQGYGYSYIEQAIDLITGWLFAMGYNKEAFSSSSQPKGFITFEGEKLDITDLEELQRQWTSMFTGLKGLWKTPFLQHNAKWNSVAPSNQDMQWDKYTQKLESWICAIHGIDAAEMGQRIQQAQNVLNENPESKIAYSKDRGLKDILSYHETYQNELCNEHEEWEPYEFAFTGFEDRDQKAEVDVDEKQNQVYKTINEIRKEHDLDEIEGGDVINNQAFLQSQQIQQQDQIGIEGEDKEEYDYSDEEIDESVENLAKSFRKSDYLEIDL